MRRQNGLGLLELIIIVAIIAIIALCAAPSFGSYRRRASVVSQANELREIFRAVRSRAIARSSHAGVKFVRSGDQWTYALYDDGDGDGIRTDDINSGVDPRYAGPKVLTQFHLAAIALLPYPIRDPDGDPLLPTSSPVQFNRSTICSFAASGSGTPGTIYITDGGGELYAVRVYGASGRVRMLRYDGGRKRWERK
jgi:type II secretory pathway pseudopilin PulG